MSTRQRELLDQLEDLIADGKMADRTMAELAAHMGCSLRTLYGISSSKDELIRIVVDRRMRSIGRKALDVLKEDMTPLDMLRAYLATTNEAVQPTTRRLARALKGISGAEHMMMGHGDYVVSMTRHLLDRAVEAGEIAPVDTVAVAHTLGELGGEFSKPDVREHMTQESKVNADLLADIILRGLPRP